LRLAAQVKLGFYAADPKAVGAICQHLTLAPRREGDEKERAFPLLDPCAGEGLALRQIADHLGLPPEQTYAVELDAGRAAMVRENIPGCRLLGPASFMGVKITAGSFSVVYANPPFDDELGGGQRQEHSFAERATRLLKPGGVLVLVMPITAIRNNGRFKTFLDAWFQDAAIYDFPADVRPFREVVYFAKRRKAEAPTNDGFLAYLGLNSKSEEIGQVVGTAPREWLIPWCRPPATFAKIELTEDELVAALGRSPLNRRLAPPPPNFHLRPPADLSTGHVALQLASGMLDGTIYPPDETPHVVRGTAKKTKFQSKAPVAATDERGNVTSVTEVWSEKIVLTVRAVGEDGEIVTLSDGAGTTLEAEEES
jgi:predicted RNA methylase